MHCTLTKHAAILHFHLCLIFTCFILYLPVVPIGEQSLLTSVPVLDEEVAVSSETASSAAATPDAAAAATSSDAAAAAPVGASENDQAGQCGM